MLLRFLVLLHEKNEVVERWKHSSSYHQLGNQSVAGQLPWTSVLSLFFVPLRLLQLLELAPLVVVQGLGHAAAVIHLIDYNVAYYIIN